ncbi:TIGR03619 family F420-dependent LLM class oxidoreductase [Novosphingobium sp. 9U]|uniref:TIGR03619 family F420-dependent LLM class oxidoreductase n=1 Tax=Novosphingobium sp. 9U TaxID=2653158 RepID=UPI0012F0D871|nr:TIGR03619 family F420-dependent LLM class oxidoreductase [Novosphingobium sp. 9U]VWX48243.1 LLM class F420-dependent oxidoreductase [Novosphingobium sp. 9U]
MKVGITCAGIGAYASGEFIRTSARLAEEAGLAHYWFPEHVVQFRSYPQSRYPYADGSGQDLPEQSNDAPLQFGDDEIPFADVRNPIVDPVLGMAWAAAATRSIEVGSNILILPQRNPVLLAKALATLDSFSEGRVLLGAGVGWAKEEADAVGSDFASRGKRTDEAIDAMRALWLEEASTHHGTAYRFTDAYAFPKPSRAGGVPILIGGESTAAMKRVAQRGDGWLPYNLPLSEAPATIARLHAMTRDSGRDPAELRIIKIIYSSAELDDLRRYRDAGVTEFNIASSGELPLGEAGMAAMFAELHQRILAPLAGW